ncbi:MAG TPA: IS3 family transposase, partial [Desulfobacteria bacterium]|nr:IS3 family transposase [Desulfobacteria bacterium]
RVRRLMKELGIRSIIRRRRYPKGTPQSGVVKCPNILARDFKAEGPGQKLVSDITYLFVGSQRYYLSAVMDLFNNEIVSYKLSKFNNNQLVNDTIEKLLIKKKDVTGAILHSDQGHQYTSKQINYLLKRYGIIQSMSRKGNPLDNAPIESFFGHLKCEAIYSSNIKSFEELNSVIEEYLYFYNNERPQKRLNKMAPVEYLNRCS